MRLLVPLLLGGVSLLSAAAALAGRAATSGALVEYSVRFDGTHRAQVGAAGPVLSTFPAVARYDLNTLSRSRDGRLLSYDDGGSLYVGAAGADGARAVTPATTAFYVPPIGEVAANARFSPNGESIAFTGRQGGGHGPDAVYVVGVDGTSLRQLTVHGHDPSWSSDGTSLAFTMGDDGRRGVYVVGADGASLRRVAHGFRPVFAPTGRRIAYIAGAATIAVVNGDGSGRRFLERGAGASPLVWSPDGTLLAWTGRPGLEVASAGDGWRPQLLVRDMANGQRAAPIAVSPKGDRIAYAQAGRLYTTATRPGARRYVVTTDQVSADGVRWSSAVELDYLTVD